MKNELQLIQLFVLICELHDKRQRTCFQRFSNNANPGGITDPELVTIYFFGLLHQRFEKKAIYEFIQTYWLEYFPKLPSYQTFVARLNQLEPTFQSLGAEFQERLSDKYVPEIDRVIDSMPVMLARGGHAYSAVVACEGLPNVGYCASKKLYFYGVRLHTIAQRRGGQLPLPHQIWMHKASCHDVRSIKEEAPALPNTTVISDSAYADAEFESQLAEQGSKLHTPRKKPKGKELSEMEKYYNRCVSRLRQPIEGFFNWLNDKTDLQNAGTVRSSDALMVHCFGKLAFAYLLLVFNP